MVGLNSRRNLLIIIILNHNGVGGRGIWGNFISGIFTKDGLGGRILGFIPPLAKGISGASIIGCLNVFYAIIGALNTKVGILLMLLGLF